WRRAHVPAHDHSGPRSAGPLRRAPPPPLQERPTRQAPGRGMRRFEGKTALVTGGARGIGLAITRAFHREGASVVAVTRREEQAAAVREEFRGDDRFRVEVADVRDRASLERLRASLDDLHILVPNARL